MRNCLVLGTGRSGTSMVAGVLDKSGYNTGDDYVEPRQTNPRGFYEDELVNTINDQILRTVVEAPPLHDRGRWAREIAGLSTWFLPRRIPDIGLWLAVPSEEPSLPDGVAKQIEALMVHRPFAYKDPRFCWTLPVWRPFLPDDVVLICVFREPDRTANSICREISTFRYRHVHVGYQKALEIWQASYEEILRRHKDNGRWVFVHFEQMLSGTGVEQLADVLGTPLDPSHIDPNLKRSSRGDAVPDSVGEVYAALCDLAGYDPGFG